MRLTRSFLPDHVRSFNHSNSSFFMHFLGLFWDLFFSKKKNIRCEYMPKSTLQGTNISPPKGTFESMIFLFLRWDMLLSKSVVQLILPSNDLLSGLNETAICKEGGAKGKWVTLPLWSILEKVVRSMVWFLKSTSGEFVTDKVTSFFKQHAPKPQNRKGESLPSSC